MKYEDQRRMMLTRHLLPRGIKDPKLIEAFLKVPRELFMPLEVRNYAYSDHPVGIGEGQTISQPYIVALMLEILELTPGDHVLEIGTGSGYQTALLAEIVETVYTIETKEPLAKRARSILKDLRYKNINYLIGDGSLGWQKAYPPRDNFEKIVVSASAPSVPESLINQLSDGGRLVIPCGSRFQQELVLIEKKENKPVKSSYGLCAFVPLIGEQGWKNS